MASHIPATSDVRAALERMTHAQLVALKTASGVSLTTIWGIRDGSRKNPGIETVRKLWPHMTARRGKAAARAAQAAA